MAISCVSTLERSTTVPSCVLARRAPASRPRARGRRQVGQRDDVGGRRRRLDLDHAAVRRAVDHVRADADDLAVDRRVDVGAGHGADVDRARCSRPCAGVVDVVRRARRRRRARRSSIFAIVFRMPALRWLPSGDERHDRRGADAVVDDRRDPAAGDRHVEHQVRRARWPGRAAPAGAFGASCVGGDARDRRRRCSTTIPTAARSRHASRRPAAPPPARSGAGCGGGRGDGADTGGDASQSRVPG